MFSWTLIQNLKQRNFLPSRRRIVSPVFFEVFYWGPVCYQPFISSFFVWPVDFSYWYFFVWPWLFVHLIFRRTDWDIIHGVKCCSWSLTPNHWTPSSPSTTSFPYSRSFHLQSRAPPKNNGVVFFQNSREAGSRRKLTDELLGLLILCISSNFLTIWKLFKAMMNVVTIFHDAALYVKLFWTAKTEDFWKFSITQFFISVFPLGGHICWGQLKMFISPISR